MKKLKLGHYMNLKGDWRFKFIFYQKAFLIHFLNEILEGKEEIKDIIYLLPEQLGKREEDRKAIFDAYCCTKNSEIIIIEMQNMPQVHKTPV
jgi:hypothetical protein